MEEWEEPRRMKERPMMRWDEQDLVMRGLIRYSGINHIGEMKDDDSCDKRMEEWKLEHMSTIYNKSDEAVIFVLRAPFHPPWEWGLQIFVSTSRWISHLRPHRRHPLNWHPHAYHVCACTKAELGELNDYSLHTESFVIIFQKHVSIYFREGCGHGNYRWFRLGVDANPLPRTSAKLRSPAWIS